MPPPDDDPLNAALAAPAPASAPAAAYLDGLNPAQRQAVETLDGPVLLLAGAGTGKTRALTTRLVHILASRRAFPNQILAVTFTNKAAREMKERVAAAMGGDVEGWWLGTFHALSARILRRHAELVGLDRSFTILDTDDQLRLVKQLLVAGNIDAKRWPARLILSVIDRWKDKGLRPEQIKEQDAGDVAGGRMRELYAQYQSRLKDLNACDFGDLLLHCLTLFKDQPDVLARYHRQFRYILVDEYQDTNTAQYLWLRLLAQAHKNLCCVGDDDQSIYGWRGAEIGNILRFETDFPGAAIIRLERNYRSTGHILGAASGLIAHNQGRLGKTLFTEDDPGDPVLVRTEWDSKDEARYVGEEIEALHAKGVSLDQIAVLVRASFQMREFEERFLTIGLPYRVIGGPRFYERAEIRDALAYLRVIAQPADDLAFERIVNVPKRGIGASSLQKLAVEARRLGQSLSVTARTMTETDALPAKARTALGRLVADFERWRGLAATERPETLLETVLDDSGYTGMWQAEKSPDAPGRLENLKELRGAVAEFDTLAGFLEHVGLVMDQAQAQGVAQVSIMTLHGAKGLEFDQVFLPGWEEGVFPNQRALDETGIAGLEEERRLAYVGLTRARKRAVIVSASNRMVHGQWTSSIPSRFIDELPTDHVDATSGLGPTTPQPSFSLAQYLPAAAKRAAREPETLVGKAYTVTERSAPKTPFTPGDRVFHQKFGYGTVESAEGDKLLVTFDHAGPKKVIDSFVKPADAV